MGRRDHRASRFDADGHQYLCAVFRRGLQGNGGDGARGLRLGLLDDLDERLGALGEVVVELAGCRVQDPLDVGVDLVEVDGGQVDRGLAGCLQEYLVPGGRCRGRCR